MDKQKVDMWIITNAENLPAVQLPLIREQISNLSDDQFIVLQAIELKKPVVSLILSLLLGELGIDRFYIGDIGMGLGKLLTLGGCGIWALVDLFLIKEATRKKNYIKMISCL